MKTAGIITLHCTDNFGAVLQCYALQECIKKELDINVEIIDYNPKVLRSKFNVMLDWSEFKERCKTRGLKKTFTNDILKRLKTYKERKRKKIKFNFFRKEYLNLSKNRYDMIRAENAPIYDYYITGSDQVWNPNITEGFDETFFLKFARNESVKISYAASIAEKIEEEHYNKYKKLLKEFDYISVRENQHKEVISKLTTKEVFVTLDPTLLLEKADWLKLVSNSNLIEDEYILLYCLEKNDDAIRVANKLSEEYKIPVVHYYFGMLRNKIKYDRKCFYFEGPNDFLWYIKNAKFVVTSSFHGTVFSVMFNKNFYTTLCVRDNGTRVKSFLNLIGLEDRIVYDGNIKGNTEEVINFSTPIHRLEIEKSKSIKYLKMAFNKE